MNTDDVVQAITDLEKRRCEALLAGDRQTLIPLIAKDLVHIHASGKVDDYDSYVNGFLQRAEFIAIDRRSLDVRDHGNVAIATGILHQIVRLRATGQTFDITVMTSQVWKKSAAGWQQVMFHACHAASE
jgi:ketosteroid isomerase-like protein